MIGKAFALVRNYLQSVVRLDESRRRIAKGQRSLEKLLKRIEKNQSTLVPFLTLDAEPLAGHPEAEPHFSEEYRILLEARKRRLVSVRQPLVLISQIHRSGGTLLSQLFDGHPELHSHPYELLIGFPDKTHWPELRMQDAPAQWFNLLYERSSERLFREGYSKPGSGSPQESLPFLLPPLLLRSLFFEALLGQRVLCPRDILDAYMTAYFNGWLDNQNLYRGRKKWITAFVPRLLMEPGNLDAFFGTYPDGRVIQILREPKSWYASAVRHLHAAQKTTLKDQTDLWARSVRLMIDAKARYPDRVKVVRFEELVHDTPHVMKSLAEDLGIAFDPILLEPTFNLLPMRANSSFRVTAAGIVRDALDRTGALSEDERRGVDAETRTIYENALEKL